MLLTLLFACGSFGEISGEKWNKPAAAVFGYSSDERLMVVMSDLPSLCAELESGEEPNGEFWLMTLWSQNRALDSGEYNADGYFVHSSGDEQIERSPDSALLNVRNMNEEEVHGSVDIDFSGDDYMSGSFNAIACPSVYLFMGMED